MEEGLTAAQASAAQQDKATAELQALAAALAETREQVAQQSAQGRDQQPSPGLVASVWVSGEVTR